MYGYHEQLTIEEVFLKVNQKEIFTHVFGKFQVGEYLVSPFRNDEIARCANAGRSCSPTSQQ